MPSKKLLLLVLTVCLTMTSCANSPRPNSVPPPQLPTVLPPELAVVCSSPPLPEDSSMDAAVITLKLLYDLYGQCAGRHTETIDYLRRNYP